MTDIIEAKASPEEKAERAAWAAGQYARDLAAIKEARRSLYTTTADPLFFKSQRGEATQQEWLDAIAAINAANPYPAQDGS